MLQARRLTLAPLDISERSDAYYTYLWILALLGNFGEVVRLAEEGIVVAESAHGAAFSIGIAGWGAYALYLLGRWDEVLTWSARERAFWIDAERPQAGLSLHGFYSGLAAARARQDERAEAQWRQILEEIIGAFDPAHPTAALMGIATLDVERLVAEVVMRPDRFPTERSYHVEHVLGIVVDRNGAISLDALENLAGQARSVETPLLEAQARRALGVLGRRPDELHAAIRLFEGMRVAPYVARAQIELGQLLDDEDHVGKGSATLRALGDVDHLARIGLA